MRLATLAPETPLGKGLMLGLRLFVGGVFIAASVDKIIHVDRFADVVWDYQLLPATLVNAFSACLPWIELVLGVLLPLPIFPGHKSAPGGDPRPRFAHQWQIQAELDQRSPRRSA